MINKKQFNSTYKGCYKKFRKNFYGLGGRTPAEAGAGRSEAAPWALQHPLQAESSWRENFFKRIFANIQGLESASGHYYVIFE